MFKILSFKKDLRLFSSVIVLASMIGVLDAQAMTNENDDQKSRVGKKLDAKTASPLLNDQKNEDAAESLYQKGLRYLESEDDSMARTCFEEAKKNGHKGVQTGEVQIGIGAEYWQKGKFLKAIEWFEWGAKEGHTGCLYNLGIMNLEGIGVSQNEPKALKYFERALENTSSQDEKGSIHYRIGLGYYHNENFPKAFEWFQKAAAQDNKDALFGIGLLYHRGEGVPQDPFEALKWYKKAKKSGHPEAQANIAETQFMIGLKFSATNNFIEAMKWYNKASKKNHARAQHNIAVFHLNGEGVPENPFEAIKWFKIAKKNGATKTRKEIAKAQANIANHFYENKNFIEAVKWSKKSAKKGHSQAQFNVGVAYSTGKGVSENPYKALKWFKKAKESGNPEAQNALAETQWNIAIECRDKGNFSETLKWFEKAKEDGDEDAQQEVANIQRAIGMMYADGNGIPKNSREALEWFKKSNANGHPKGKEDIIKICFNIGLEYNNVKNFIEAKRWFEEGAKMEDPKALYLLAVLYYNGNGVPENNKMALEWFEKAKANGHPEAQKMIAETQYFLAQEYFEKEDYEMALEWLEKAKANGNEETQEAISEAQWNIAIKYRDKGNFSEALKWFEKAKENGDEDADKEIYIIKQKMKE